LPLPPEVPLGEGAGMEAGGAEAGGIEAGGIEAGGAFEAGGAMEAGGMPAPPVGQLAGQLVT